MVKLEFSFLKFLLIFTSSSFLFFETEGQQDAQFTQYMYNSSYFNPAFAGKDGGYRFSAVHRSQWLNYTGSGGNPPITQFVSAQAAVEKLKLGVGLNFVNDNIGPTTNQEVNLSLAYHKRLRMGTISFGAMGGIFSSNINYFDLNTVNPDPSLPETGSETQTILHSAADISTNQALILEMVLWKIN
jgi:type IX secretion system PorP/SprF family membrane protein